MKRQLAWDHARRTSATFGRLFSAIWALALLGLSNHVGLAAGSGEEYAQRVRPVFRERCVACHGALKQEAGLRLDTAKLAIQGGESGAAIIPGDPSQSLLISRVTATDSAERMPPEGEPLKPQQIEALSNWIAARAEGPADETPERDPRDHWSFRTPARPPVPEIDPATVGSTNVGSASEKLGPIDAFLAADRAKHGLVAQGPADKRVWLRRVTFDLIGLPPTPAEVADFLADESPEAIDKVVSRLLESPAYGQRWGRHWMDIWRYSDWWGLGAEVRNSQKHIWHWRDWIVESLNADKGYDQMLREMLAADELYPNDLDRLRATGYLARQYFIFNRTVWLDETIEHTAKGMLGLTFNCAKCHDHKYDPLTQVQYYELRAIFEPYQLRTEMAPGQVDFEVDGIPRAFDAHPDVPTYLHIRGDDRNPDETRPLRPSAPAFIAGESWRAPDSPIALPPEAAHPGWRAFVFETHRATAERKVAEATDAVTKAREKLTEAEQGVAAAASAGSAATPVAPSPVDVARLELSIAEKGVLVATDQLESILARGQADAAQASGAADFAERSRAASRSERVVAAAQADLELARAELGLAQAAADKKTEFEAKRAAAQSILDTAKGAIEIASESYSPLPGAKKTQEDYQNRNADSPYPTTSTGRRSAFARWLTDRRNPLTARVAVNHVWMRHMGRPLVPTIFDFGRKGAAPTHPELLDWLAVELMDKGWSMKDLHRAIVTSRAYRTSSSNAGADPATLAADPGNRFYWRMEPVRLEAQIVRDSLLSLAGELDLSLGGPSIPIDDENSRRRGLYFTHSHNDHQKFLATFDDASVLDCYRRSESIVPQQALAMENSPLVATMAEKIARRIEADHPEVGDADFVRVAYATILTVEPSPDEQAVMAEFLASTAARAKANNHPNPSASSRMSLVRAILNHNDFLTIR